MGWKGVSAKFCGRTREKRSVHPGRPPQHIVDTRRAKRIKSKSIVAYKRLAGQGKIAQLTP